MSQNNCTVGNFIANVVNTQSFSPVEPIASQVQRTTYLKVINPSNKKEFTMFTLRNINFSPTTSPQMLKQALFDELGSEVLCRKLDFALGYFRKSTKLWLNNEEDVHDAYDVLLKTQKLTFWCMGKKPPKYYGSSENSENEDEEDTHDGVSRRRRRQHTTRLSMREERTTRVKELKTQLRENHGSRYSGVQYALWAETIVAGTHESLEEPPPVPMFGAQRPHGNSRSSGNLTEAFTVMADKLTTAFTAQPRNSALSSPSSSSYSSPSKSAELRGKYLQQLRELVELRDIGALTEEEYEEQRFGLVNLMKKLHEDVLKSLH